MARAVHASRHWGAVVGAATLGGALLAVVALSSLGMVGAAAAPAPSIGEIYREASPGVVRVISGESGLKGSGFLVDAEGLIVTNAHVVGGAERVSVTVAGAPPREGEVVRLDAATDLALVRIEDASGLRPLALATSRPVSVGDPVIAIGAPFGLDRSVSAGIVSGLARQIPGAGGGTITGAIQTDAALNPGNSGGPLLASDGSVIGVTARIATRSGADEGVGFAIPAASVAEIIGAATPVPGRGYLGVGSVDIDAEVAATSGLPAETTGVLVIRVFGDGPALRDGLRLGDAIVGVNAVSVRDNAELAGLLSQHTPGDQVSVTVLREGGSMTHRVVLGDRPSGT